MTPYQLRVLADEHRRHNTREQGRTSTDGAAGWVAFAAAARKPGS